jgi:predicted O-methyltransferase YrrM
MSPPAARLTNTPPPEEREAAQIERLRSSYSMRPAFPLPATVENFDAEPLRAACETYREGIAALMAGGAAPGLYDPNNAFFRSPDAEILYAMARMLKPRRIVEVGSGHSTRIIRQAISDGDLKVHHVAIDPAPRSDVTPLVDRMQLTRFEEIETDAVLSTLESNDFLFIDSSHEVRIANDVVKLFCITIPSLASGVVVHVHDIFLPYDYPEPFYTTCPGWGEQYLLQVLLTGRPHKVHWPGYYAQRMRPELRDSMPFLQAGPAQSFWFQAP